MLIYISYRFIMMKSLLKSTIYFDTYLIEKEGKKCVEKIAKTQESAQRLTIQSVSSQYFKTITPPNYGIDFAVGEVIQDALHTSFAYPFVEGDALASVDKPVDAQAITSDEVERVSELFHFYSSVQLTDLPILLQNEAKMYTKEVIAERMRNHLQNTSASALSENEKTDMLDFFVKQELKWGLDIHDVTLWNIIRTPEKRLIFIDTEYARWGMKWYDLGYFAIQTAVYGQNTELARSVLWKWITTLEQRGHTNIQNELLIPMIYRIAVNINECQHDERQLKESVRIARQLLAFGVKGF